MQKCRQVLCAKRTSNAIKCQATSFADGYPVVRRKGKRRDGGGKFDSLARQGTDVLLMLPLQRKREET